MRVTSYEFVEVRENLTRDRLHAFMRALADSAPGRGSFRVYFIGGATAVDHGWRESTIDADISADNDRIFRGIQKLKESLHLNVELARPEDFVPALAGAASRHLFIDTIGAVSFFHYDPYSQLFSKLVRGLRQDLEDAESFLSEGLVESEQLRSLVDKIPQAAYSKYPALSRTAVHDAINEFLSRRRPTR